MDSPASECPRQADTSQYRQNCAEWLSTDDALQATFDSSQIVIYTIAISHRCALSCFNRRGVAICEKRAHSFFATQCIRL